MSHVTQNHVYIVGAKKVNKEMPVMTKERLKAAKDSVAKYRSKKK